MPSSLASPILPNFRPSLSKYPRNGIGVDYWSNSVEKLMGSRSYRALASRALQSGFSRFAQFSRNPVRISPQRDHVPKPIPHVERSRIQFFSDFSFLQCSLGTHDWYLRNPSRVCGPTTEFTYRPNPPSFPGPCGVGEALRKTFAPIVTHKSQFGRLFPSLSMVFCL